ncbi:hypothetical protein EV702DRAFT_1221098 [Suillus placidus]|uniref:NUDE domain-containing protein n=1 Tax=Suillus placidus TaxID=48579 RepID=A0A9P6ZG75_9AGAM|nr:hypothetical protein EV702DRAFT_1221098 [Suillus placidus]
MISSTLPSTILPAHREHCVSPPQTPPMIAPFDDLKILSCRAPTSSSIIKLSFDHELNSPSSSSPPQGTSISHAYTKPPSTILPNSPAPSPRNSLAVRECLSITSKQEGVGQVCSFISTGHTQKAQQDLKVKVTKTELDEWKTTHNATTTSLQRELDTLRQESQKLKVRLHGLELGNDDLERNERVVVSSLADREARYSKALEEIEHKLLDKTNLKEELQRVKDELRDSSVEIFILKDQLTAVRSRAPSILTENSNDNLLSTPPPPDLEPSDHSSNEKFSIPTLTRPPSTAVSSNYGQSVLLQHAGFQLSKHNPNTSSPSSTTHSNTLPTLAASRNSPRLLSLSHDLPLSLPVLAYPTLLLYP